MLLNSHSKYTSSLDAASSSEIPVAALYKAAEVSSETPSPALAVNGHTAVHDSAFKDTYAAAPDNSNPATDPSVTEKPAGASENPPIVSEPPPPPPPSAPDNIPSTEKNPAVSDGPTVSSSLDSSTTASGFPSAAMNAEDTFNRPAAHLKYGPMHKTSRF